MRSVMKENIMEHSEQVAQLAHALAVINNVIFGGTVDAGRVVISAVFHEASEVITGDLPTPIKYYNKEINSAYKKLEYIANKQLVSTLPPELQKVYEDILNESDLEIKKYIFAADKLAAYIKCLEEIKCGNTEFINAKSKLEDRLYSLQMPELQYFLDTFISGFQKTLDELE